ncbi:MAG: hypothetical protein ACRBCS_13040 [Cellvibrionaceae bacterium]
MIDLLAVQTSIQHVKRFLDQQRQATKLILEGSQKSGDYTGVCVLEQRSGMEDNQT